MTDAAKTFSLDRASRSGTCAPGRGRRHTMYVLGKGFGRFVFSVAMNVHTINPEIVDRDGPFVVACTHLSHLDPFCVSILVRRPVEWLARKEFYKYGWSRWLLNSLGCIKVNRQGIPVSTIREAIARLNEGRIIGICPDGGVAIGADAAMRRGPIKRGVSSVAIHANVPIVPCVTLGTHKFNRIMPWLPIKSAHLYVAYGQPIQPPAAKSTRASRLELTERLRDSFNDLYQQLLAQYSLRDADMP